MKPWFVVIIVVAFMAVSCNGKKNSQSAAGMGMKMQQVVTAVEVLPQSYTVTESYPATLAANTLVQLRPDVSGYIDGIHVKDGSWVTKGQVLYDIDKSRYQAAYNQALAALQQANATLSQQQRDYKRYTDLKEHDAIASQLVDQAQTTVQVGEANVAAAKAALAQAATNLNHAVVRAPITGKIGISLLKLGDVVNAGQTLINTIVNDNPIYADFNIPQNFIPQLKEKGGSSINYNLQVPGSTTMIANGKLLLINNQVDPQSGTVTVRLEFPNSQHLLQSGMNAAVVLLHPGADSMIAVPTKSLIHTLGETAVFVVGNDNVVSMKNVEDGSVIDSLTVVHGLNPGDRIVVDGLQKIKPGDTVKIANPGAVKASGVMQKQ